MFLTSWCNCKLLVQQCPGRLVGAVVAERKWPPRTSQWLLCRLSKEYGSFPLFEGWNWTKRGLKLYGARWVLEETLWFIISVIQDVPQLCVEAKLKAVSGCPYGSKNLLVITIQTKMTTNTNQNMPNKWVIYHYTGDIFEPAICSSASEKEQEQSLLALPRILN